MSGSIYATVSRCRPCPAGAGPRREGFAPRAHCYEEVVVQPQLAPFRANEGNQELPFREVAAHRARPADVI